MEDDRIQRLTLFIGECFNESYEESYNHPIVRCKKCGEDLTAMFGDYNRDFDDDWNDMKALKEKLVEKGMWDEFEHFAYDKWEGYKGCDTLANWLLVMPRFAELVHGFIECKG